jgi:trans-2,3-dihydro-3-hydroxyanthranilate isomerase
MELPYYIVDVFAEKKYAGNQLAVFANCNDLTTIQMQQIATEINFAESTFITNYDSQTNVANVRIFTPEYEMKFAGHPTIGTSWILMHEIFNGQPKKVQLLLPVGLIPVNDVEGILWFQAVQPVFYDVHQIAGIQSFTNLLMPDFNDSLPVQEVSTGSAFVIVPLKNKEALAQLIVNKEAMNNWLNSNCKTAFRALYFFCMENDAIYSRMLFIENNQLKEDAATGSASSCLLAYLLKNYSKKIQMTNHQGNYINRPSQLYFDGEVIENEYHIKIGGKTQFVAKGVWQV